MKIYHYVPGTGLFCGEDIADESPLEPGVFLIPAYATELEPPTSGESQQAIFKDGVWALQDIPVPIPELVPTAAELLQQAQTEQLAILSNSAASAYVAGFQSSASGAPLWYDSDADTQTVINRQYLIALSNPTVYSATTFFTGAPVGTTPVRAKLNQTAVDSTKTVQYLIDTQMVQLGNDLATAWSTIKAHLWTLQATINSATTVSEVQAITW